MFFLDVENFVDGIQSYLFYEESNGVKNCFTAISTRHAFSFNHGHHETWVPKSKEVCFYYV
jgi:predicted AlkP superfamily pyrophosphatase or phosphodiesterase